MTEATKKNILDNINYKNKILKVDNPIINRNIRKLSHIDNLLEDICLTDCSYNIDIVFFITPHFS
mgnify:CR=1 FL=1